MNVIFVDYLGKRRSYLIEQNIPEEKIKLFHLDKVKTEVIFRKQFETKKFITLTGASSNAQVVSGTPTNFSAGSIGVAHFSEQQEIYSENVQVRSDKKADCVDIEVFMRFYYPKEGHKKLGGFPFHNIPIEIAKNGFLVGFECGGKEYLTKFKSEDVRRLIGDI